MSLDWDAIDTEVHALTHAQLADELDSYRTRTQSHRAFVVRREVAARLELLDAIGPPCQPRRRARASQIADRLLGVNKPCPKADAIFDDAIRRLRELAAIT